PDSDSPARFFHSQLDPVHATGAPQAAPNLASPTFPIFVKPVRGAFSVHTSHIADPGALTTFLSRPCVREFTRDYLGIHHRLQQHFAPDMPDACCFLAEMPLRGVQVTVEGFVQRGRVETLGVVDSIRDARTGSFVRFEYPSALAHEIQLRMV